MDPRDIDGHYALALKRARKDGDVAFLLDGLRDPTLRFMAVQYLGELRATEAVASLLPLLLAGDVATRSSTAKALGEIGEPEAVPGLIELALDRSSAITQTYAITALGKIGDPRALTPLCELLDDPIILLRQSAARALGVLDDPDAIEPLKRAARRERWFSRRIHRKSIRRLAGHRALPDQSK